MTTLSAMARVLALAREVSKGLSEKRAEPARVGPAASGGPLKSDVRDVRDVFLPGIQGAFGTASRTNADPPGQLRRPLCTTDFNCAGGLLRHGRGHRRHQPPPQSTA